MIYASQKSRKEGGELSPTVECKRRIVRGPQMLHSLPLSFFRRLPRTTHTTAHRTQGAQIGLGLVIFCQEFRVEPTVTCFPIGLSVCLSKSGDLLSVERAERGASFRSITLGRPPLRLAFHRAKLPVAASRFGVRGEVGRIPESRACSECKTRIRPLCSCYVGERERVRGIAGGGWRKMRLAPNSVPRPS